MAKKKNKIRRLSEAQYNAYITALKNDAALYNADGSMFVPGQTQAPEKKNEE